MIRFFTENKAKIAQKRELKKAIQLLISKENKSVGDINYIFCNDDYLLEINQKHLQHDYYTDIITFNYVEGNIISSDLYISTERIIDNAQQLNKSINHEFLRVIFHGILHLCGYNDKTEEEITEMRAKENYYIKEFLPMFHVKHILK